MSLIIYPQSNNKLAVIFPAQGMSIQDVADKDVPSGTPYLILSAFPDNFDISFFDAYDFDAGSGVVENIANAQAVQKNNWRALRAPILAELDHLFSMAVERGDSAAQATIAAQKQALRDVTKVALPSDTIANIKAVMPSILSETYTYPTA